MEKGIECGVRITKSVLMLKDDEFEARLQMLLPRVLFSLHQQRAAHQQVLALQSAKNGEAAFAAKTVEVYCRTKDSGNVEDAPEKGLGLECTIGIKQFAMELAEKAYSAYVEECLSGFRTCILEQRRLFIQQESQKSVQIDVAMKGIEVYCGTKHFC